MAEQAPPTFPPQILCRIFYFLLPDARAMGAVQLVSKKWSQCAERVCAMEGLARGWTTEDAKGITWNKCINHFGNWWRRWNIVHGAGAIQFFLCFVCVVSFLSATRSDGFFGSDSQRATESRAA